MHHGVFYEIIDSEPCFHPEGKVTIPLKERQHSLVQNLNGLLKNFPQRLNTNSDSRSALTTNSLLAPYHSPSIDNKVLLPKDNYCYGPTSLPLNKMDYGKKHKFKQNLIKTKVFFRYYLPDSIGSVLQPRKYTKSRKASEDEAFGVFLEEISGENASNYDIPITQYELRSENGPYYDYLNQSNLMGAMDLNYGSQSSFTKKERLRKIDSFCDEVVKFCDKLKKKKSKPVC